MKNPLIVLVVVIIIGGAAWYVISNNPMQTSSEPTIQHDMTQMMTSEAGLTKGEMVICPVTGEKIAKSKAYSKMEYKGKIYYFCCAGCPDEFKKNPEKYIKK